MALRFDPELAGKLATIEKDGTVCKFNYAYKNPGRFTVLVSPKADQDDSCKVRVLALNAVARNGSSSYVCFGMAEPNMNLSKILKSQKKNICMDGTGDTSLVMFGEYAGSRVYVDGESGKVETSDDKDLDEGGEKASVGGIDYLTIGNIMAEEYSSFTENLRRPSFPFDPTESFQNNKSVCIHNLLLVWRKNDNGSTDLAIHAGFDAKRIVRVPCPPSYTHFAISGKEGCDFTINTSLSEEAEKRLNNSESAFVQCLKNMNDSTQNAKGCCAIA